ncbi:MAG: hypothetical protein QOH86_1434 [Sphingomonadales bacterium]|jgi:hypothetical protein|nr:hypothetical protein [Sphingomonadales bacterium]
MDSLRAFDEDPAYAPSDEVEDAIEAPPEIGVDERRMHVRAYNYWVSLLDGRPFPSIRELDPRTIDDFGPNSVLLDFTEGAEDAKVAWLGRALREECDLLGDIRRIGDVPKRSLLSRLTDHYMQIIANQAPIGFEAEFVGQRGQNTMYRGILMPFSSTGETIDFIYGVINWKEVADSATTAGIAREARSALAAAAAPVEASPVWADGPNSEPPQPPAAPASPAAEEPLWDEPGLPFEAGLADRLCAARECAEAATGAEARSRAALYRALGHAYDFALAAEAEPADYAEMLEDAGIKPQARAPMTAVAKLVFGAQCDKARLTEFAAALSWARREALPMGSFAGRLESTEGGLKAIVAAERRARRPEARPDGGETARAALRGMRPLGHVAVEAGDDEFVLLVGRRDEVGGVAVLARIADPALLERAIRKTAA